MSVFAAQPAMIAPPRYACTKIQPPPYRAKVKPSSIKLPIIPQAHNFYPLSSHPTNTTRSSTRSSSPSPTASTITTPPEPTIPPPTYSPSLSSRSRSPTPSPPRTKPPPYTSVPGSLTPFSPSSPTTDALPRRQHLERDARMKSIYSEDDWDMIHGRDEEDREPQSWWCSCLSVGPPNAYDDARALPWVAYYVF